jgi:NAD(P)-dependent dehydrogenase (short-subunit alcohol dehydrogenase family)
VADAPTILIAGASRGLGHGLAAGFAARGWHVIGTVRAGARTLLHDLADAHPGQVEIETLDIDAPDQIAALSQRLSGRSLDILFVNAGTIPHDHMAPIGDIPTDEFVRVMVTNALSPMRVIETLQHLVSMDGLIGAMTSGQGSIANNSVGMRELYRGSKAALNMFMRSFAAREAKAPRAMLVLAPGWIRTDMGGADAPYTLEESIPLLVDVLIAKRAKPGLDYLDRFGAIVPW